MKKMKQALQPMFINRMKKTWEIEKEASNFTQYKIYGKKNPENIIVGWGSTKGVILDAINGLDCAYLQILYIDPFPKQVAKELQGKNIILIENNSTSQLADLIREKTGILIKNKNKILKFDARPFLCNELNIEIKKRLG